MSFGPELVWFWAEKFKKFNARRVFKVDGGDSCIFITLSGGHVILLSWGAQNCGAALIDESDKKTFISNSKQMPPITNVLKSQLNGSELFDTVQIRRDRILRFEFHKTIGAGFTNTRFLFLEAMERYSNLILTDDSNIVIETAKHIHPSENRYRSLLPGQPYVLPPEFSGIALEEWLRSPEKQPVKNIAGLGRKLIKLLESKELSYCAENLSVLYCPDKINNLIPQQIGNYMTVFPIMLDGARKTDEGEHFGASAVVSPLVSVDLRRRRAKVEELIQHEITRRERQCEDINKLLEQNNAEDYRRRGEMILSNIWQLHHGKSEAKISTVDANGNNVTETISLDPSLTPSQNAAVLFAKYRKISAAQARAAKLIVKVDAELSELKEELAMASCIEDAEELEQLAAELGLKKIEKNKRAPKRSPSLPPHKRFDLGCAIVFAGLSAKGNRYVTFKLAAADDTWFHVQGIPGSHVILRYNGVPTEEQTDTAQKFCASLAVYFSKGRGSSRQRVDFTQKKYVTPIRGGVANVTYKEFSSVSADSGYWQEYIKTSAEL